MSYNPFKTARKAALPLIVALIVRAAMEAAKSAGLQIEENVFWEVAALGYSAVIALINYIKNHKKGMGTSA